MLVHAHRTCERLEAGDDLCVDVEADLVRLVVVHDQYVRSQAVHRAVNVQDRLKQRIGGWMG